MTKTLWVLKVKKNRGYVDSGKYVKQGLLGYTKNINDAELFKNRRSARCEKGVTEKVVKVKVTIEEI